MEIASHKIEHFWAALTGLTSRPFSISLPSVLVKDDQVASLAQGPHAPTGDSKLINRPTGPPDHFSGNRLAPNFLLPQREGSLLDTSPRSPSKVPPWPHREWKASKSNLAVLSTFPATYRRKMDAQNLQQQVLKRSDGTPCWM